MVAGSNPAAGAQKFMILDFIFLTITYSGGYLVVTGVTILTTVSFLVHKHGKRILPLLMSVEGSAASIWVLKHIFNISRPEGAFYLESSPSFPSGHAAMAIALYGFLLYTIWKHKKHHLQNKAIWGLSILIILIGLSRLYLGVHYLSDVLVGYLVGALWLMLSIKIQNRLN